MTGRLLRLRLRARARDVEPGYSARAIADSLRRGDVPSDAAFDHFLAEDLRCASGVYWTQVEAAVRAAEWLDDAGVRTVTDIGSGVGKFCVVAALAGHCELVGIEHRQRLVRAARGLAELFEVGDRVRFIDGKFGEDEVPPADAYYLYNPFGENLFGGHERLDQHTELSTERYFREIAAAEELLRRAPLGTRLLTYNGYGGLVPDSYREVRVARDLPCVLRLWEKARPDEGGVYSADAP